MAAELELAELVAVALSWYRSLARRWEEAEGVDMTVDTPSLLIQAATTLERHVVAECGHWMQQERSADVKALLIGWLTDTVG